MWRRLSHRLYSLTATSAGVASASWLFASHKFPIPISAKAKPYFVDNFVRIGEALRAAKPDLVVNTGDISLDGASRGARPRRRPGAARRARPAAALPARQSRSRRRAGDGRAMAKRRSMRAPRALPEAFRRPTGGGSTCRGWRVLGINALLLGSDLPEAAEQEARCRAGDAGARPAQPGAVPAQAAVRPDGGRERDQQPLPHARAARPIVGDARRRAGADRERPHPSVPLQRCRRLAPCLGAVDGLRGARSHPADLRRQEGRLRRAHAQARRHARQPHDRRARRAHAEHRRSAADLLRRSRAYAGTGRARWL